MTLTHNYRARWEEGRGIVVTDPNGTDVQVQYGGTLDNCTATAYVAGAGFIGGWNCLPRGRPFEELIGSINAGRLYPALDALPHGPFRRRTR